MLSFQCLYVTINFRFHVVQPMCTYGDPAYPLRVHLQCPFRHRVLIDQMNAYNASMSAVRTSVEWLLGDIRYYFKSLHFKKKNL